MTDNISHSRMEVTRTNRSEPVGNPRRQSAAVRAEPQQIHGPILPSAPNRLPYHAVQLRHRRLPRTIPHQLPSQSQAGGSREAPGARELTSPRRATGSPATAADSRDRLLHQDLHHADHGGDKGQRRRAGVADQRGQLFRGGVNIQEQAAVGECPGEASSAGSWRQGRMREV